MSVITNDVLVLDPLAIVAHPILMCLMIDAIEAIVMIGEDHRVASLTGEIAVPVVEGIAANNLHHLHAPLLLKDAINVIVDIRARLHDRIGAEMIASATAGVALMMRRTRHRPKEEIVLRK